jgi:hypothetical protein
MASQGLASLRRNLNADAEVQLGDLFRGHRRNIFSIQRDDVPPASLRVLPDRGYRLRSVVRHPV